MAFLLVVDDDADVLDLLDWHCRERGHAVAVASSCEKALTWLRVARPPRLILLDFFLPKMDGACFVELLRAGESTRAIPVIIMSAASPDWVARRLVPDPLVRVVCKPFDFASLDRMIEESMSASGAEGD
ncbi:MAG: response regulator [Elusimicrobia bacterium]|nr:response regulator [Elusimicrobiota bacterium]